MKINNERKNVSFEKNIVLMNARNMFKSNNAIAEIKQTVKNNQYGFSKYITKELKIFPIKLDTDTFLLVDSDGISGKMLEDTWVEYAHTIRPSKRLSDSYKKLLNIVLNDKDTEYVRCSKQGFLNKTDKKFADINNNVISNFLKINED